LIPELSGKVTDKIETFGILSSLENSHKKGQKIKEPPQRLSFFVSIVLVSF